MIPEDDRCMHGEPNQGADCSQCMNDPWNLRLEKATMIVLGIIVCGLAWLIYEIIKEVM